MKNPEHPLVSVPVCPGITAHVKNWSDVKLGNLQSLVSNVRNRLHSPGDRYGHHEVQATPSQIAVEYVRTL